MASEVNSSTDKYERLHTAAAGVLHSVVKYVTDGDGNWAAIRRSALDLLQAAVVDLDEAPRSARAPIDRAAVLEEAAKAVESLRTGHHHPDNRREDAHYAYAADEIRALKDADPQVPQGREFPASPTVPVGPAGSAPLSTEAKQVLVVDGGIGVSREALRKMIAEDADVNESTAASLNAVAPKEILRYPTRHDKAGFSVELVFANEGEAYAFSDHLALRSHGKQP